MADMAVSSGGKAPASLSTEKSPLPGGSAPVGGGAKFGRVTKAGIPVGSEELLGVSGGEEQRGADRSDDKQAGEGRKSSRLRGKYRTLSRSAGGVPFV